MTETQYKKNHDGQECGIGASREAIFFNENFWGGEERSNNIGAITRNTFDGLR